MEIKVNKILNNNKVLFSSEFGHCIGTWCEKEVVMRNYSVEIDIPDKLDTYCIKESKVSACSLDIEGDRIKIVGLLEEYEDDGFATLRMKKSIICFETVFSEAIKKMRNRYIEIRVNEINLFDQNII